MQKDRELVAAAFAHYRAGRLRGAENIARMILDRHPDDAQACHLLGLVAYREGRRDEALSYLSRAVDLAPMRASLSAELGIKCDAVGQTQKALTHCRRALALEYDPDCDYEKLGLLLLELGASEEAVSALLKARERHGSCAHLYNNLGLALSAQGKPAEAIDAYRQALHFSPDYPDAHNNLGTELVEQGKLEEAVSCFQAALQCNPDHPDALYNLGLTLYRQGMLADAIAAYQEALRFRPEFTKAHVNLGGTLVDVSDLEGAISHYQKTLALDPHMAITHNNLASALLDQGCVDACIAHCEEALNLDPSSSAAYSILGELTEQGHYSLTAEQMRDIRTLVVDEELSLDEKCPLHFTLGLLLHKEGRYDDAFAHYRRGNELRLNSLRESNRTYDPVKHAHFIGDLIRTFTAEFFERIPSSGLETQLPVFIVGMPRSGTTLVQQILASHHQAMGAGELRDLEQVILTAPEMATVTGGYPTAMTTIGAEAIRLIAMRYLEPLTKLGGDALRVVDKMPQNFFHLGAIAALFPNARIIHCRREAMDVCLSCYFQNFKWYTFTSKLEDLGWHYRQYERLMTHWREVLPIQVFEIHYEELVSEPESNIRKLLDFCGLDRSDRCLAFHEKAGAIQTASRLQVRKPIYTTSVARWKPYEAYLGPLREALLLGVTSIPSTKRPA